MLSCLADPSRLRGPVHSPHVGHLCRWLQPGMPRLRAGWSQEGNRRGEHDLCAVGNADRLKFVIAREASDSMASLRGRTKFQAGRRVTAGVTAHHRDALPRHCPQATGWFISVGRLGRDELLAEDPS